MIGAAIGVVVVLLSRPGMYRLTRWMSDTLLRVLVNLRSERPSK